MNAIKKDLPDNDWHDIQDNIRKSIILGKEILVLIKNYKDEIDLIKIDDLFNKLQDYSEDITDIFNSNTIER